MSDPNSKRPFKQLELGPVPTPGSRLVLAEDYDDGRETLAQLLRLYGYDVLEARDGVEALAAIDQCCPKAVIADIEMPKLNGLDLAKAIRDRHGPVVRLIALSGVPVRKIWTDAMAAGFDYYLMKPVDGEQLIPYIEGPLERLDY